MESKENHSLPESLLMENSNSVHLVDALKFFGGWHSRPQEATSDFLTQRMNFRRTVTPKHKLEGREFLKTVFHKKMHGGHIVKILVDLGVATEGEIAEELTKHHRFPYLPLKHYDINPETMKTIPEDIAREYLFVPLDMFSDNLMIAMVNPLDQNAISEAERLSGCFVQVFVSTLSEVISAIEQNYRRMPVFSSDPSSMLQ